MTILTDDLIRKAIDAVLAKRGEVLNGAVSSEYEVAGIYARAALEAVLPDVVEKCARLVEDNQEAVNLRTGSRFLQLRIEGNLAGLAYGDGIRSLLNKEGGCTG